MDQNLSIILLAVLVIVIVFVLPQVFLRMAISSVIRTFRENRALSPESARSLDELGLRPKSMLKAVFSGMQYRGTALMVLRNAQIIELTEDRKLYLSEENLSRSKYGGR